MNTYIQKILTKKMTRKEFLSYLGVFFLTIFGISSLLKNLLNLNTHSKKTISSKRTGKTAFGRGAYGV
jgi:Leucine-rich repeat (LRR) protein